MNLFRLLFSAAFSLAKALQDIVWSATEVFRREISLFFFLIDYDKEEEIFEEMTLNLRSYFPESWWWQLKEVKNPGNHRYCNYLAR